MIFYRKFYFLFVLLLMGITTSSDAQTFASKGLELNVLADVAVAYDDNVTYVNDNKISDFITQIGVGLDFVYEGKKDYVSIDGRVIQNIFASNGDFNNLAEEVNVVWNKQITEYNHLKFTNAFIHSEEPRSFQDAFGRTEGRYDYVINRFGSDYIHDISRKMSVQLFYDREDYHPDSENIIGAVRDVVGIDFNYAFSSDLSTTIGHSYEATNYDPGGTIRKNKIYSGVQFNVTQQLVVQAKAGADFIDQDDNNLTKPSLQFSVTNDFDENTALSVLFVKEHASNIYREDIFDFWQASVNFVKKVLRKVTMRASTFYGEGDFVNSSDEQSFYGIEVGVEYEIIDDVTLSLREQYSHFDATDEEDQYARNIVFLGLNWLF